MGEVRAYLIPALDGVAYGLLLSLLSAGLSLCWGTGRVLNLAHGTLYLIGAYAIAAISRGGWPSYLAAMAVGTGLGAIGGAGLAAAIRPVARQGPLSQALLTVGLALVVSDLLTDAFGTSARAVAVPAELDRTVRVAGQTYPLYRLLLILIATTAIATGAVVLRTTRIGATARAAADDPSMLATLGINPQAIHATLLAVAGGVAGLAGALGAPLLVPGPGTADAVLLLCLVVVVLGGLNSLAGVLVAGVFVGEVQSIGVLLAPAVTPYLLFGVLVVGLAIRRPELTGAAA